MPSWGTCPLPSRDTAFLCMNHHIPLPLQSEPAMIRQDFGHGDALFLLTQCATRSVTHGMRERGPKSKAVMPRVKKGGAQHMSASRGWEFL